MLERIWIYQQLHQYFSCRWQENSSAVPSFLLTAYPAQMGQGIQALVDDERVEFVGEGTRLPIVVVVGHGP